MRLLLVSNVPFVLTSPRMVLPIILILFASSVSLIEIPSSLALDKKASSSVMDPPYSSLSNLSKFSLSPKYPIFLLSLAITHPFFPT